MVTSVKPAAPAENAELSNANKPRELLTAENVFIGFMSGSAASKGLPRQLQSHVRTAFHNKPLSPKSSNVEFSEFVGFHPTPQKLLKKFHQNFNIANLGFTLNRANARFMSKFLPRFFQKAGGVWGEAPNHQIPRSTDRFRPNHQILIFI
jgi:hypothetical protein